MLKLNFKTISLILVGALIFAGVFLGKEIREVSAILPTRGSISCVHNADNTITINWAYENVRQRPHLDIEWFDPSEGRRVHHQVTALPWNPRPDRDGFHSDSRSGVHVDTHDRRNAPYRLQPNIDYTYHIRLGSVCGVDIIASAQCTRPAQRSPDPDPQQRVSCNSVCMERWGCPGRCVWKGIGCLGGCPREMRDPETPLAVCSLIFPCERCCCNCPAPSAEITCTSQDQNSINLNIRVRGGYDDLHLYRDGVQITRLTPRQRGEHETVSFADRGLNQGQNYVYQVRSSARGRPNVGAAVTCQIRDVVPSDFTIEAACLERSRDYVVIGYRYANPPINTLYLRHLQDNRFQKNITLNSSQMVRGVWHEGSAKIMAESIAGHNRLVFQFIYSDIGRRRAVSNSVECSLLRGEAASHSVTLRCLERGRNHVVIGYNYSNLPTTNPWLWEETTLVRSMITAGRDASGRQRVEISPTGRPMYWTLNNCSCPGRRVQYSDRIECTPSGREESPPPDGTPPPRDTPPPSSELSISLSPGWNMISWPATGSLSSSTLARHCGTSVIWSWSLSSNNYHRVDQIVPGQGYWVQVDRTCTVPVSGEAWRGSVSLTGAGWQMVGSPSGDIGLGDIGGNCQISSIQWWDPSLQQGRYVVVRDRLRAGRGYFIRVDGTCELVFSPEGGQPPRSPVN